MTDAGDNMRGARRPGLGGCDSGQLSDRWISCRHGRGWSRFRGTALVGGLIAGLVIGAGEWFALRRRVS
jgi:hypothetical protein